jgi:hypothetical protein
MLANNRILCLFIEKHCAGDASFFTAPASDAFVSMQKYSAALPFNQRTGGAGFHARPFFGAAKADR